VARPAPSDTAPPRQDIAPRPSPVDLLFLGLLAGLAVANHWLFARFGGDYLAFWQRSGALIGLGTAAIGWAWGAIDRNPGLVSANPRVFTASALQLAGLPLTVFGGHLAPGGGASTLDRVLILPAAVVYAGAVLGWLLIVAPAQYFVFLLAGAPSRVAWASRHRVHALMGWDGRLRIDESPPERPFAAEGWWDASMRDRPVSMAGAFAAAGFALLNLATGFR
jgi:hypothetical protein